MLGVLVKEEIWTQLCMYRGEMRTQGEDSYIQANRRGLEQLPPSQPSEGTNAADILILDLEFLDSRFVRKYISFI